MINGSKSTDKTFIANSFCEYFSFIAECLKRKSILLRDFVWSKSAEENLPKQFTESQFTFKVVKESDILKELKNLKRKKASGLDNFPPGLLKDAAYVLTTPLTFIINLSLKTKVVPSEWKVAKVIPLYKSGSLAEIDNYRPISILPTLSKILERIVYKQLMAHLERHNLLFEYQFGFRQNRSTELAVTYFTDLIRKEVDSGKATGAVFIDLSNTFDTISHSVLLSTVNCPIMAYMIWNFSALLIIYSIASRSFNFTVCFLNQIQLTLEFLKEVVLGPSFFSSSLMMCIVRFVIVRLSLTLTIR